MTLFALVLVVAAGFFHATWNLLAKRAGSEASGPAFVWLYSALSTAIFAPLAVGGIVLGSTHVGAVGLLFMFGTGVLHIGYFLSLQEGYRVGDLSIVYPLARGARPLLASGAAIVLPHFSHKKKRPAAEGGLATGRFTSVLYTRIRRKERCFTQDVVYKEERGL